jgi:CDP-diglyceride synthetase
MTVAGRSRTARYLRFLVWVIVVSAVVAALGYAPTRRLAGADGIPAMLAGCLIGALASLAGALPVVFGRGPASPAAQLQATLLSMAVRFGVVLALGLAVALSGWFERGSLLIWIAISYLALLVVDTRFMLKSSPRGDAETLETR